MFQYLPHYLLRYELCSLWGFYDRPLLKIHPWTCVLSGSKQFPKRWSQLFVLTWTKISTFYFFLLDLLLFSEASKFIMFSLWIYSQQEHLKPPVTGRIFTSIKYESRQDSKVWSPCSTTRESVHFNVFFMGYRPFVLKDKKLTQPEDTKLIHFVLWQRMRFRHQSVTYREQTATGHLFTVFIPVTNIQAANRNFKQRQ